MSEKKHKRAKPAYRDGFGIVDPYGQFWSTGIFETEEAARDMFNRFWGDNKDATLWSSYRVVPARLTISEITPTQETTR